MSATLPRARPGRAYVVRLPNGLQCPIPSYVAGWRALRGMDPCAKVRGWDHTATEGVTMTIRRVDGLGAPRIIEEE